MKVWFKVVLVLTLAALLGGVVIGCSGGGSGPEDVVRSAFKAMEARDAEKMASYFTEDITGDMVTEMQAAFDIFDSIKIKNLELTVASQTDDTAIVDAEYDFEIKMLGETSTEHQSDSMDLVKVDGKWLINTPISE